MLRRKYPADNLKREKEKTIARCLDIFLSHVRDAQGRIAGESDYEGGEWRWEVVSSRNIRSKRGTLSAEGNATKRHGMTSEFSKKETTEVKVREQKKPRGIDKSVGIKLATIDRPGTSKSPDFVNAKSAKSGTSKEIKFAEKGTGMRNSLSVQRLQEEDDVDDDVGDDASYADEFTRDGRKYILVGWDSYRSKLMIFLLVLLVLWAVIYFPLIGT